jgi:hypothetical protein
MLAWPLPMLSLAKCAPRATTPVEQHRLRGQNDPETSEKPAFMGAH